ncbi:MAG: OB-fold nucleic acid binding domain-containing protein [Candidatus Acidiferrales bacterium]|jgi:3'-5' exoribonuclease
MKSPFVAELRADQTISTFFLVSEKEIRSTRDARRYLRLQLTDRTGSIEARMWDGFEKDAATIEREGYVKIQGRVESYRGKLQLAIERLRRAELSEVDTEDYLPQTKLDVEALFAKLKEYGAAIANPHLQRLVRSVLEDPQLAPRLKRAPAAKMMHHAYLGGLLEHVVSLCGLAKLVAAHYPEVDADLLMTGVILHDIGKLDELSYERSIGYTTEGQLLGHILIEYELLTKKMDAIEGFPAELKTAVQHMLISHHGQYEFGSPKRPMFREALLLHYLDDMDSKMAAARATLASDAGDEGWTAFDAALDRRLLRLEDFLKVAEAAGVPQAGTLFDPKPADAPPKNGKK